MAAVTVYSDFGAQEKKKASLYIETLEKSSKKLESHIEEYEWLKQWHPTQCSCLENPMDGGAW